MAMKSEVEDLNADGPQPPVTSFFGYAVVLVSFLALQGLRVIVKRFTTPRSVAGRDRWKWQNIQISWVHSTVTGVGAVICFYKYPELSQDMVVFTNHITYGLTAFSTGYFISDFVDVIFGERTAMWEIILHHVAGLALLFYNVASCRYIGYTTAALLAEVHSICLHGRKLMQLAGVSFQNPVYRLNNSLNMLLFLTFRIFALSWITYGVIYDRHRVTTTYFYVLGVAIFMLWCLNIGLLWRLVKNDILRDRRTMRLTENGKHQHSQVPDAMVENNNKHK